MAIKIKAQERNISFQKGVEKYAYVLQADLYSKLSQAKVINEASLRSGISKGAINAAWDAIGEVIKAWATEGHSVAIPGLGSMRFGINATSVEDVNKVANSLITSRKVIFTPNVDIKQELKNTSISITCYDRNGNLVKRVTSTDDGTIEDPKTRLTTLRVAVRVDLRLLQAALRLLLVALIRAPALVAAAAAALRTMNTPKLSN